MPRGVCKLCLNETDLLESHFIPAGVFAQLREDTNPNPNPILITPAITLTSSQQPKDYVFCPDCENRFNRLGERWVLANMCRNTGFLLQESLAKSKPILYDRDFALFAGASIPSINMDALVYFAMSIFWRGAIHECPNVGGKTSRLDLAEYLEPIRLFLLGGSFPAHMVISISVWPKREVLTVAYTPIEGQASGFRAFKFMIPGIEFRLFLGEGLPPILYQTCSQSSSQRCIMSMSLLVDETRDGIMRTAKSSKVAKKLQGSWPPTK